MKVLLLLLLLFACSVCPAVGKHQRALAPGLEGSTVGNLTLRCHPGWGGTGTSTASMDRCCLLRARCSARLAARRCRPGPSQPLSARRPRPSRCRSRSGCQRSAQLCRLQQLARRRGRCQGGAGHC